MEQTLIIIKPDGVKRGLAGEIISRFERVGLHLVAMKMTKATQDLLEKHYDKNDAWFEMVGKGTKDFFLENGKDLKKEFGTENPVELGKQVLSWLFDYVTSGPVIAMVWEGPHVVEIVRKHVGPTYPINAAPGTIRGDYHFDSPQLANFAKRAVENMVHASGTVDEAKNEIKLWFGEEEIYKQ